MSKITSLEGEASIFLAQNNDSAAIGNYQQILSLANELKQTKYANQASQAYNNAYKRILEITGAQEATISEQRDIPFNATILIALNQLAFAIAENAQLYNLNNQQTINLKEQIPNIVSASLLQNQIAAVSKDNRLYIINPNSQTANKEKIQLTYSGKIAVFGDNIYILDPPANQIWKIVDNNGYNDSKAYIANNSTTINNAIDFAIDGNIYTISSDCSINRFSRGNLNANYTISLPANEKANSCSGIFTNENSPLIFVTAKVGETSRLIELNKDGSFAGQYLLKDINCNNNCIVDPISKKLYKFEGNKVQLIKI